uniref:Uncharacterized protein n=1 Tax=Sphenodon punctatus TaxID=8508 RepID=A0A8D0FYF5_SPHPU
MEERKMAPEAGSLLKSYKWRMGPQELERHPTLPGGSKRWTKLQHWKRSQSQQESDVLEDAPERPGGRAAARRSVFQRAFSAPAKAPKSQECGGGGGGRLNLRKYLRSMSHRRGQESGLRAPQEPEKGASFPAQPAPQTLTSNPPIWDVANISLLEGRLVLLGREEEGPCRKRTSSCVSETSSLKPLSYQLGESSVLHLLRGRATRLKHR